MDAASAGEKRVTKIAPQKFSGTMYTIVYNPHPHGFANYALATVTVKDGRVTDVSLVEKNEHGQEDRSVYLGAHEVVARLDLMNSRLLEKLRKGYPAGYRHV